MIVQIKTIPQVEAALGFFALVGPDSYDAADFEKKCGVGMNTIISQEYTLCLLTVNAELYSTVELQSFFFLCFCRRYWNEEEVFDSML